MRFQHITFKQTVLLGCGLTVVLAALGLLARELTEPATNPAQAGQPSTHASSKSQSAANIATRDGLDWPTFLGPNRDSKSMEQGLRVPWPKDGPRVVWQRPLGSSYGIGSVAAGRYFQFDGAAGKEVLDCLHAETGERLWTFSYPIRYQDALGYENGPRCSPVIDQQRVYIYGVTGMLHCLDVVSGKVLWKVNVNQKFGVVQNFFGVGSTPVIEGDWLITMVGGSPPEDQGRTPYELDRVDGNGSAIVAFDKRTGAVGYQLHDELASYASPRVNTIQGQRWGFAFCRGGLLAFDPKTGQEKFHYPWRARLLESVNASTPVVVGNEVLISETYGPGSTLLRVNTEPAGYEVVWRDAERSRTRAMQAHWNTPIYHDGYLYGSSGRNPPDADLRCVEWSTGKVMWSVENRIRCSLLFVDGYLISLGEYGTLQLIRPNPRKFELVSEVTLREPESTQPTGFGPRQLLRYPCWAAPVLSRGLLYVRGADRLVCLEVIPPAAESERDAGPPRQPGVPR